MFTNRYILFNSIGFYLFIGGIIFILYRKLKFALPIICCILLSISYLKLYTGNYAIREIKQSSDFMKTKLDKNSMVFIYPQWANLGLNYYFVPDIFKDVDHYYNRLTKNKIFPLWGLDEAKRNIKNTVHSKIIYYQNNATTIDPNNLVFNFSDSTYVRKDSISFAGGLIVSIFEKPIEVDSDSISLLEH